MKIAIFSGEIPSSTFIENLIKGVVQKHQVLLFGVMKQPKSYENQRILIYTTPINHLKNSVISAIRIIKLLCSSPKALVVLWQEVSRFSSRYDRWIWFTKFLPIVLYKPDILHLQWARDLEFYYFIQTKFGIKIVVSLRGAHINYTPIVEPRMAAIYRQTFPHIMAFHAVSEAIAQEAQGYGANSERITVIRSPLSIMFKDRYVPYSKPTGDVIQLIAVGRFHWIKGYTYLLAALSILKSQGIKVRLTIVGASLFTEEILFQVHQLQLESDVHLLGTVDQAELPDLLLAQHALVLPSLEEGIANVVLEAMAVGLPVISSNCGGMSEVVVPDETGWLVPVRDPQAIADAVIDIQQRSEEDLRRITDNAHEFVKANFNAEDRIGEFLEWYERS